MTVKDLCAEIETRRMEALDRRIEQYARSNPIASDLGECEREMVLAITHWGDKPPITPALKARFDRGRVIEDLALNELAALGIYVRVERRPFELKNPEGKLVLRGKVDGFIEWEGTTYAMEVKSVDPNIFRLLHAVEDFDRFIWAKKWPRQLQAYLYSESLEEGLFLLDDCMGHWKLIAVPLDWESIDRIIRMCESAVAHRDAKTLPDFHTNPAVCKRCWAFGRVCTPPMTFAGMETIDDAEFEAVLDRRGEVEAAHREYEALNKQAKERLEGKTQVVVGNWYATGKEVTRTMRPQPEERIVKFWQTKIERVQGDDSTAKGD